MSSSIAMATRSMTCRCAIGDSFFCREGAVMKILATYRTKIRVEEVAGRDATARYVRVLKQVKRHHLNLPVLRAHPRWASLANSDLMPGIIAGLLGKAAIGRAWFDLDALPPMIRVEPDKGSFMASVHLIEN